MRDGNGNYLYLRPMEPAAVLAVPNILQNPELPTGCESVALTMLLHYWGYDTLGKTEIADHYLSYDTTNFVSSLCSRAYCGGESFSAGERGQAGCERPDGSFHGRSSDLSFPGGSGGRVEYH